MSTPTPSQSMADRNLLLGILALQMDFIGRDVLIQAMHTWLLDKAKPLGQILVEQGALGGESRALLEAVVKKHIKQHGGDAEKSLAAVRSADSVRQDLEQFLNDPDVQASLAHVSVDGPRQTDTWETNHLTVGASTSAGLRFRILRPHAKGGLGEVFVAHDEELHREVALKEIQDRHADDSDSRARFVLEAEITGGLEHPGIVPVYGLGAYADGRPFYAMRFIKGDSLQNAIQRFHAAEGSRRDPGERALALRELLGRFVDVCNAIAYAHSRGVLHRDLKPGNIMLGKYGETLVVDWGLAKVAGRTESTSSVEEVTLRPCSASDSAPTQLGAALGTPPYMSPEQAAGQLEQLGPASDIYSLGATLYCLLTGQLPFRSNDVGVILQAVQRGEFPPPRRVKRAVPAALEAICLKAMARKPEERYPTALALAADVEHWLADEPVAAYREPWTVRAGRWARRHKPVVAAVTAAVLVAVLLGGVGAWWWAREEARRRQGVEATLGEVARLQRQARWAEARAVLDQAESQLGEGGAKDLRGRLEQARRDLDLVARLDAIRLKRATIVEGRFDNLATADREYAEVFRESGLGEVGGDEAAATAWVGGSKVREPVIAALDDWVGCAEERRCGWLLEVARRADPDPWRDRARSLAVWHDRAVLEGLAAEEAAMEQSPSLIHVLASRLRDAGGDSVGLLRRVQALHPNDFWLNFDLGNALDKDDPKEAMGYYRAALALRPGTTAVHTNLGNALHNLRRLDEAVAEFKKAIALDPKHALPFTNLGNALHDLHRLDEAVAEFKKAIDLDPKYARAHNNLGFVLHDKGQLEEAIQEYRQAIKLDPKNASPHSNLGLALSAKGQLETAIQEYRQAIDLDPKLAKAHNNLGCVLVDKGQLEGAIQEFRQAIKLDAKLAELHFNLGNVLRDTGQWEEAIQEFRQAIALDAKLAEPHVNLGGVLYGKGQLEEAIQEFRQAIKLDAKLAQPHVNLGGILGEKGQWEAAIAELQKAITLLPANDPDRKSLSQGVRQCERLLALDKKLPGILEGDVKPADAELIDLAQLCQIKKRYFSAARFSADAFIAQPKLADDLEANHRYNAACSAARAAAGQGEDAAKLDDKERARWRKQALDWLRADLARWAKQIESGKAEDRTQVRRKLLQWQRDSDLTGLRDAAALANLRDAERADFQKLWTDVAALLKKCAEKDKP